MGDDKFYFGVIAMLLATLFSGVLLYIIWTRQKLVVTQADIEKAREIARGLING